MGDITYVWTAEGWLYLACILDLASRRIVGWSMSDRIRADLVCQALKSAYWLRKPKPGLIMHTDRGQYASASHRKLLRDYKMIPSMSRKANCWDNAAMESFFKTLKVERIYQLLYDTRAQARLDIVDWIEGFYRPHALGHPLPNTGSRRGQPHRCIKRCASKRGRVTAPESRDMRLRSSITTQTESNCSGRSPKFLFRVMPKSQTQLIACIQ